MVYSPDIEKGHISRISVIVMGLLWCQGSNKDLSELVYTVAMKHMPQDERDEISMYNPELKKIMETMIRFVCIYYQLYSYNIDPQSKQYRNQVNCPEKKKIINILTSSDNEIYRGLIPTIFKGRAWSSRSSHPVMSVSP